MASGGKENGSYNIDLQNAVKYLHAQKIIRKDKDIATKMKVGQGTVSNYVNGRSRASDNFRKNFETIFNLNLRDFSDVAEDGIEKPGSDDHRAELKEANATIRSYNTFLQRMLESNLSRVLEDQTGISALIGELLLRNIDQEAGGNPDKAQEILKGILRRIGPKLSSGVKEDIAADGRS